MEWTLVAGIGTIVKCYILLDFETRLLEMKRKTRFSCICYLITYILLIIYGFGFHKGIVFSYGKTIGYFTILLIFAHFFLKGKVYQKIFYTVLAVCVETATMSILVWIISNVGFYNTVYDSSVNISTLPIARMFSSLLFFYLTRLFLYFKKQKLRLRFFELVMFMVTPIVNIGIIAILLKILLENPTGNKEDVYLLTIAIGVLASAIIHFIFLRQRETDKELKLKYALLEYRYQLQKKNIDENIILDKANKKFRHDFKNNLLALKVFLEEGEIQEAIAYVDKLRDISVSLSAKQYFCEDEILNYLLNEKLQMCRQCGVECIYFVMGNPRMDAYDALALVGNLLDNAREAAEKSKDKKIKFGMVQKDGSIEILVKNTIADSVLKNNPELSTTKKDAAIHGEGIRIMKETIEKYNGMIDFYEEGHVFFCRAIFYV